MVFHSIDPEALPRFRRRRVLFWWTPRRCRRRGRVAPPCGALRGGFHGLHGVSTDPHRRATNRDIRVDIVPPDAAEDAGDGIPVYASDPFQAPEGSGTRSGADLLEPGESTTVIGIRRGSRSCHARCARRRGRPTGSTASRAREAGTFSGDVGLTAEDRCRLCDRRRDRARSSGRRGGRGPPAPHRLQATVGSCR